MIRTTDIVYGCREGVVPFDKPTDCVRYRLRMYPMDFGTVMLRFHDRVEMWLLGERDGRLYPLIKQKEIRIG